MDIPKLYEVYTNVLDMLVDRGCDVKYIEETYRTVTYEQYRQNYKSMSVYIPSTHNTEECDTTVIFYDNDIERLKKDELQRIINEITAGYEDEHKMHITVIVNQLALTYALTQYASYKKGKTYNPFVTMEILSYDIVKVNITKHELAPVYTHITDQSIIRNVLDEFDTQKDKLPKIKSSDPVAKWYNARVGQMFEIHRSSERNPDSVYYRIVV